MQINISELDDALTALRSTIAALDLAWQQRPELDELRRLIAEVDETSRGPRIVYRRASPLQRSRARRGFLATVELMRFLDHVIATGSSLQLEGALASTELVLLRWTPFVKPGSFERSQIQVEEIDAQTMQELMELQAQRLADGTVEQNPGHCVVCELLAKRRQRPTEQQPTCTTVP